MMRAIHVVLLLVALIVGLPTLAQAHSAHGRHDQISSQQVVKTQRRAATLVEAPKTTQQLAPMATQLAMIAPCATVIQTSYSNPAASAVVESPSVQFCVGGCCCPGMSGCGMGACCHTGLTSDDSSIEFPAISTQVAHRLYGSAALTIIIGLDRPPKV